jgi:hypothetical protein
MLMGQLTSPLPACVILHCIFILPQIEREALSMVNVLIDSVLVMISALGLN